MHHSQYPAGRRQIAVYFRKPALLLASCLLDGLKEVYILMNSQSYVRFMDEECYSNKGKLNKKTDHEM